MVSNQIAEPMKILFDTNVWIDVYFPERPGHAEANSLIDAIFSNDIALYFTSNSISDVFFISGSIQKRMLREQGKPLTESAASAINEISWGCIKNMDEIALPLPSSIPAIFLAIRMKDLHHEFEDDLMMASAQTAGIDFLVTNDKLLLTKATIPALSSTDMLKYLEAMA